jgi:hypothetical protein
MNLGGAIKINKCAVIIVVAILLFVFYVFTATSIERMYPKKHEKINLRKLVIGLILAAKSGGNQVIKISNEPDFGGIKTKGKTLEGETGVMECSHGGT